MPDIHQRIAAPSPDKLRSLAKHPSIIAVNMAPLEATGPDFASQMQMDEEKSILLSYIIPWSKRPELYMALKKNRDLLADEHTEMLVVTTASDAAELKSGVARIGIPGLRIVQVEGAKFNRCCFLNLGAYCSRAERLFLLDCDFLVSRDTIAEASAALDENTFIVVREALESDQVAHRELTADIPSLLSKVITTDFLFTNGNRASYEYVQSATGRSLAGLMMLNRNDFLAVGGLNSQLPGWSGKDYDLQIRLQAKLGRRSVSMGSTTHVSHSGNSSDAGGVRLGPESMFNMNEHILEWMFYNYNKGNFLGTYSQDVAQWGSKIRFV